MEKMSDCLGWKHQIPGLSLFSIAFQKNNVVPAAVPGCKGTCAAPMGLFKNSPFVQ